MDACIKGIHIVLSRLYLQRIINVVDFLSGSLDEGLLLWHACRMRDAGNKLSEVTQWLTDHCGRICHWVTVNELSNLKRSGRLSSAGAFGGTMLDIKPIIKVAEIERDLCAAVDELQTAIVDGDSAAAKQLCRKASALLSERNRLCKLNKT